MTRPSVPTACSISLAVCCLLAATAAPAHAQATAPSSPPMSIGAFTALAASQRPRATVDQLVDGFSVEQAALPQVFQYLLGRDHLIVGIELLPPPSQPGGVAALVSRSISRSFGSTTIRSLLHQLLALEPEFTCVEDAGVVNLVPRANLENAQYVFNQTVESFDVDDLPYALALREIQATVYHELGGPPHIMLLRHRPEEGPRVTVHLQQATVREIINEIAWQAGVGWQASEKRSSDGINTLFSVLTGGAPGPVGCAECPPGVITPLAHPESLGNAGEATASATPSLALLRASLAPHGFAFAWDAHTRTASAMKGRTHIAVVEGARVAALNGVPVKLPEAVTLRDGRMFVPQALLRLVTEAAAGTV